MWGWSSRAAASASARNRATSCGRGRVAARSRFRPRSGPTRAAGAGKPRPSPPGPSSSSSSHSPRPAGIPRRGRRGASVRARVLVGRRRADLLGDRCGGPEFAKLAGQLGMAAGPASRRRAAAAPRCVVGQLVEQLRRGARRDRTGFGCVAGGHRACSSPVRVPRTRGSRRAWRGAGAGRGGGACRPAGSLRPSARAASLFESCSKWRSRTISRSTSSSCERRLEPPLELAAERRGRGGQLGIAELRGQVERRAVGERRPLPAAARGRGSAARRPRCRRCSSIMWSRAIWRSQRWNGIDRVPQVVSQPLARLDQDILDDVAGIDPASHRAIEPQVDHPPQRGAMPLPEPLRGVGVVRRDALEQAWVSVASGHILPSITTGSRFFRPPG